MYNNKKILAIIPARGGSKGLPKKNIKNLCGKPLIGHTIEQALKSRFIDVVFVSTDSTEIAGVSEKYGINVPFLRPDELAQDSSSTVDVVSHVLKEFEKSGALFDYIIILEPTSPLRKENDIDNAIQKLLDSKKFDGLISVGEIKLEHPLIVKRIDVNGNLIPYSENKQKIFQRQQADKAYFPYGVIYMIKTVVFKEKKTFYTDRILPFPIERWQNYEIDDILDFICVEAIINNKMNNHL